MNKLVLILVLSISSYASAAVLHCVPPEMSGSVYDIANEAYVDLDAEVKSVSVILADGRSVTGSLVERNDLGLNALSLSDDVAQNAGINVTVATRSGQVFLLVSEYLAMSLPQQLICK